MDLPRRALLAVSLLFLAPARGSSSKATGFAVCEERFTSRPEAEDSARCFYEEGTKPGQAAEAIRRLERLRFQYPEIPWLSQYSGYLTYYTGDLERAAKLLQEAARLFASRKMPKKEIEIRYDLYSSFWGQRKTREAQDQVERAIQVRRSSQDSILITMTDLLEARHLASSQTELDRSYDLSKRAWTVLFDSTRNAAFKGKLYLFQRDCLANLGNIGVELGKYPDAYRSFEDLAALAAQNKDGRTEASARYGMVRSRVERMAEDPQAGSQEKVQQLIEEAREAQQAAAKAHWQPTEARTLYVLAMLSRGLQAREYLDDCIVAARGLSQAESSCRNAEARYLVRENPGEAQAAVDRAIQLAEDPLSRAHAWREQMHVSWAIGPPKAAITASWEALEKIEALRDLQTDSEGEAEFFSTWADDYHWLSGRLLKAHLAGEDRALITKAFAVNEQMRARSLRDDFDEERATLAQVQQTLGPHEALLSFQIAPWKDWTGDFGGGSWLLVLTQKAARIYRLADRAELRSRVKIFNSVLNGRAHLLEKQTDALYQALLAPALSNLPAEIKKLILVPDDALFQVPFAALHGGGESPLADRYELMLEPSATFWRRWHSQQPTAADVPALILANPPAQRKEEGLSSQPLPELLYAEDEARDVEGYIGGDLHLGKDASEELLKKADLKRFGLCHLATHSVIDEVNPDRSFVWLAPSPGQDGRLEASEIRKLRLDDRAVVLSSCSSAGGRVLRGEGVMSLARAFFQARAKTVVASLWAQRDDHAALLFDRFYLHLAEGDSVAAALRRAQRDRIGDGAPAAAWAGFVVLGDGDLVPVPGGTRRSVLGGPLGWAGLVLASVLLTLLFKFSMILRKQK